MEPKKSHCILPVLSLIFLVTGICSTAFANGCEVIYVDGNALGANDGTSWVNAYNYLQDALTDANTSAGCEEIWVAVGVYKPDCNLANPNGSGDRTAAFYLINNVAIYGGFPSGGGPWGSRNPVAHKTVLGGDLDNNDTQGLESWELPDDPNRVENSYHVVIAIGVDGTAILDGFTITGGNTDRGSGGGMYSYQASPVITGCTFSQNVVNGEFASGGGLLCGGDGNPQITGCTFSENSATDYEGRGGGMYNSCDANITNCTFIGNSAGFGGGMYNKSNSAIANCTFSENTAWGVYTATSGGGMYNSDGSPTITGCTFNGNSAGGPHINRSGYGGGMTNNSGSPTVDNCTFISNLAYGYYTVSYAIAAGGGGMYNFNGDANITNCTFIGNSADANDTYASGGGLYNKDGDSTITNCRFTGNSADANDAYASGGGISNAGTATIINSTFSGNSAYNQYDLSQGGGIYGLGPTTVITNCILYNNMASAGNEISATNFVEVSYSDIKGGWLGIGNINADPCFIDAVGGNYRLAWNSPCIDAGDNNSVPPYCRYEDLDGLPRIADGNGDEQCVVDMGAYEFPSDIYVHIGDFDNSCYVDFRDFAVLARAWLTEDGQAEYDPVCDISLPPDNFIDERDLEIFIYNWLAGIE